MSEIASRSSLHPNTALKMPGEARNVCQWLTKNSSDSVTHFKKGLIPYNPRVVAIKLILLQFLGGSWVPTAELRDFPPVLVSGKHMFVEHQFRMSKRLILQHLLGSISAGISERGLSPFSNQS